jgi:hypothetical protein
MTTHPTAFAPIGCSGRSRNLTLLLTLVGALATANVLAQAPAAPRVAAQAPAAEELEGLVGRIALYPDDLIGIILPSSTNPLQIVQADRYLQKRKADPKAPIDEKWDDAVKSLLNYPDVVKMMSDDLDWTSALGEAVVADSGAVLEAVQSFRRKTSAAGNLKTDDKQVVTVEKEVITIVQANPEVIYVPQYNPTTVVVYGGYSSWGYYPTPYPVYYYPYAPGAAFATGLIWGAAIGAAWNGGHYATHYGGNANININRNTNINTGNINTGNVNRGDRPGQGGGSTQWKSNKQPGQVSSSVGKQAPSARAGDARAGGGGAGAGSMQSGGRADAAGGGAAGAGAARPSAQPSGGGGGRASTQPAGGGAGGAGSASRASPSGGSAFGGYDSGRQTSMDSSRGASSRSSMSSGGGARSAPSGGGARAGGGGGGGRRR